MHDIYCLPDFGNFHKITMYLFLLLSSLHVKCSGFPVSLSPFLFPIPSPTPHPDIERKLFVWGPCWHFELNNETLHYTGNILVRFFLYLFICISHQKIYTFHMTTFKLHGAILYFFKCMFTSYNHIHVIPVLLLIKCCIRSRFKTTTN